MIALHLLRHAHAGDPQRWSGDDAERPLSEKGRRQAESLGRLLAAMDEAPDLLITSPRVRAAQTAEIIAKAARYAGRRGSTGWPGSLDTDAVEAILLAAGPAERPCLVGHDPEFSELLGELLGLPAIPMRKGAIARVDLPGGRVTAGHGILRYLVPPELLPDPASWPAARGPLTAAGPPPAHRVRERRARPTIAAARSAPTAPRFTASGGPLCGSTQTACSGIE